MPINPGARAHFQLQLQQEQERIRLEQQRLQERWDNFNSMGELRDDDGFDEDGFDRYGFDREGHYDPNFDLESQEALRRQWYELTGEELDEPDATVSIEDRRIWKKLFGEELDRFGRKK